MSAGIKPYSITAPGFLGLNLQDSPVEMNQGFALIADNCIIDKSGRIASRKGWEKVNASNADLGTSNIEVIGEVIENDGTTTIVAAGGGFLFKLVGSTLTTLTYGGGGSAPTISTNNWQFVQLSGVGIFFQRGYDPLIYDPSVSTTQFRRLSEKAGYAGTVPLANTALSAYGRIWCADTSTDKNTVTWSTTLSPHVWTGGTAGTLNLLGVWPKGGDEIVALAAHNNFLVIFGKRQILIYSGATEPATMILSDTLDNAGCIARDSVQNTGDDLIFLSASGVRSFLRTIQEKSSPARDISRHVKDDLRAKLDAETMANIKSGYSPVDSFYLLTMPASSKTYCFDLRQSLEDGSSRTTVWDQINPKCIYYSASRNLYLGKAGYVGKYSGYLDDASTYRMQYYSPWIDFGNPLQKSILKRIIATIIRTSSQNLTFKWAFDFAVNYYSQTVTVPDQALSEYNIGEYNIAEFSSGIAVTPASLQGSGTGQVLQIGIETLIHGYAISLQKLDIHTKDGRL